MMIPNILIDASMRPENFFGDHYYDCFVAMVTGCDYCSKGQLLSGFRDWLVSEINDNMSSGFNWSKLVLLLECPQLQSDHGLWPTNKQQHKIAILALLRRLESFHKLLG
jgi:hypothetical protein